MSTRKFHPILPGLFFLLIPAFLSAQGPVTQASVKTESGANDPMAHAYIEKTRKWMNACNSLEIRFRVCLAQDNDPNRPVGCENGSMLLSGIKYRLISGSEEYYCDGTDLWAYSPAQKEVSIYSYRESDQEMNPLMLIRNYETHYRAKYIRQQTIAGSARNIIDLTPLQRSEIVKIRIYLNNSDNRPFKIEMYLPQNQTYIYEILSCRENPDVREGAFVFEVGQYPNISVNDMR